MTEIIRYFFNFFVFFSAFIILVLILAEVLFKNFKLEKKHIKFYGIFMDLKNTQILSITLVTLRYIYITYCLINIGNNYISLIFIIILTLAYNITNFRLINIFIDTTYNIVLYLIIVSKDIFINYALHVNIVWYVIVLYLVTVMFGLICSFYLYIKEVLYILKKDKFIKNKENKNILKKKPKKVAQLVFELKEDLGDESKDEK